MSARAPAAALPSSASVMSASGGSKPLGPDVRRVVAEGDECVGGSLDECGRSAHEATRLDRRRPADFSKERGVDPSPPAGPLRRGDAGEGVSHGSVPVGELRQLVAVEEILGCACRVDEMHRALVVDRPVVPQHCHERDHTGAAAHEEHRAGVVGLPDEVAADRDRVARAGRRRRASWSDRATPRRHRAARPSAPGGRRRAARRSSSCVGRSSRPRR